MSLRQLAKKGVTVFGGVINLDYQRETGLLLHRGNKKEYVWRVGDPLGHLLVLPCPVIKVSGKLEQHSPGRGIDDPDLSGMKIWATPPGKDPGPAEGFAESRGDTEWVNTGR